MSRRHMGWPNVWDWRQLPGHGHDSEDASILVSFSPSFCLGSSVSIGTYNFDTGNGKWAKAGDWALPFRFCIHRSFDIMETDGWGSDEERVDTVVLLTGVEVEVVRDGSGLQMIKHKSKRLDSDIYDVL
ncbi:hypothetical protein VPH35_107459 [Triticum aestivum]